MGIGKQGIEEVAAGIPSGGIMLWHGTIANIPDGFVICDGNNSTPNLLDRFVESVPNVGTDPGATGGADAKTTAGHVHSGPSHQHDLPFSIESSWDKDEFGSGASISVTRSIEDTAYTASQLACLTKANGTGNTGSQTDSISDIRPKYYDVAFIMKT